MDNLWQLKRISTNENLGEPQPLPEDWNGIFGLHGIKEKLGDLSWLDNPEVSGLGWFETDIKAATPGTGAVTKAEEVVNTAKALLAESDWAMLPDIPMTNGQKTAWIDYRQALRDIKKQSGFPDSIVWPAKP